MTPQRRTALISVAAALVLIGVKLGAGLTSGSLGLLSEAAHSGTDLIAALLTFFAVGVAVRPADRGHPYGHGKAEHLAALAEAVALACVSLVIAGLAASRLARGSHELEATWVTLAVIGVVLAIDASRSLVSLRAARKYTSPAFATNALHFASDFAGSAAVLVGIVAARAGHPEGDAAAALFVAALVLVAAGRLARQNVDVLMDQAPAQADRAARLAIEQLGSDVELRRLRMRQAAGRHFADVVIAVAPNAPVAHGHLAADAVEQAVEQALPGADVVVHVEPTLGSAEALRERVYAAAFAVPEVRELHHLALLDLGDRSELSLHIKLPGSLSLAAAHEIATRLEQAIRTAAPELDDVQTHIEPLEEPSEGAQVRLGEGELDLESLERVVVAEVGRPPRALRLLRTDSGIVVLLTLVLDPASALSDAHAAADAVEERIRREHPAVVDVIVHTEP